MAKLERIYTVPLGDAYDVPRNKRVPRAMKLLKEFVAKHMKADGERVLISEALNKYVWQNSIQKPPRKVKVRLIKDDGEIRAYLSDEKIEEPKKEKPPEKEEKPAEKKEEKAPEKKEEPKKEKAEPKKEEKPAEKKEEKKKDE